MKIKQIALLSIVSLAAVISSCAPTPATTNAVGNGFTKAGDAIGSVVNGVMGQPNTSPQARTTVAQPQTYPQPTPYQGQ